MGTCYDKCYKIAYMAEHELKILFQRQSLCLTSFSELQSKLVKCSESISQKDGPIHVISKERYLRVMNDYFNEKDSEICEYIFSSLAYKQITKKKHLTTQWALLSILPFCSDSLEEKIDYFLRIMLIINIKELVDTDIDISSETTCNLYLINRKLREYFNIHIIDIFQAFEKSLKKPSREMIKSIEILKNRVFTRSNMIQMIDRMFFTVGFPKTMKSVIEFDKMKMFLMTFKYIFCYKELRLRLITDLDF
jgi:hypothetical protein